MFGIFNDNFPPILDGVALTAQNYAFWLHEKGHDVRVITDYAPNMREVIENAKYPIDRIPSIPIPFRAPYRYGLPYISPSFIRRLRKTEFELVHAHCPFVTGDLAYSVAQRQHIPMVATFHSKYYDAILEFTKSRAIAKMVTNQIVKVFESCDEVWACSEETGETLRSYGYSKPYHVMPNGTDVSVPENAQELKEKAASRFQLPQDKHVLLFVGQQIWYKNQRLILDTFRLLCDQSDDWFLVMVGTGKDEQDIERYAASLNLTDHIRFTGQVKDRDLLRGIYLNADLLFFPSVFDNAPLVLREAAVLAVPTLATEGSNAAGAIRKNFSGFTAAADPQAMRDELVRIFTEEDVRKIGQNARDTIPLSWEKLMPMVLGRYQTVIEQYERTR